jgi:hypothetical protein
MQWNLSKIGIGSLILGIFLSIFLPIILGSLKHKNSKFSEEESYTVFGIMFFGCILATVGLIICILTGVLGGK